ncbi:sensor histidine kinase [uncultured Robinsoniella sp.]|uniref:sensor histidine kinase n=1 Tax=uncultured Robinsoniella sp. TaxID=904190 RepID=UPI00374F03D0
MELIYASLDLFAAAIIGVLLIGSFFKGDHPKPFGKKIILLLVGHLVGLLCDSILWFWEPERYPTIDISAAIVVQKTVLFLAYSVLAAMTVIYTDCLVKFIEEKAKCSKRIVPCITVICIMAVVLWTVSLFNGMFFTFDEKGMFVSTKLYWFTQVTIGFLLCVDVFLIWKHRRALGWCNAIPLLFYILLPIGGFFLSFWWDVIPVYIAATLSMLLMFIVFHLEQDKQLREQERQFTQSRVSIMLSQIQPHFLYNTLTAICGLCDENPKEAQKVTAEFADYLRHNLDSLTQSTPVPFEDELRHTKVYLRIEQKRFGHRLNIVYDISVSNFRVPALTIQPIVENAVKHGVTKKKTGGTVTIFTKEKEDCYEIIIDDDGFGFDIGNVQTDSDTHIGIKNVRYRLWSICHGTLTITSEPGVGTVSTIRIPKGRMNEELRQINDR